MRAATSSGVASASIRLLVSICLLAGSGLIVQGTASADETMSLAGDRPDTPAYTAAVGLSSLIKVKLLPTDKIDLKAVQSAGPIDNLRLLQAGDVELAIVPSVVGHTARLGIGSFEGDAPATGFRAIATLWRDALHLVLRADDVATGTIDDLLDMKDRKVFLGDAATGMMDANKLLLADLGLDAEQAFELAAVPSGDGLAAIKSGEVDAFSVTARPPGAHFDKMFEETALGLRLLDVTETQMTRANGNHWLWTPFVIPAATYPGQSEDVWTIALSNLLVVRADVAPDVVHAITKSIFENLDYLKRIDPIMDDLALDQALAGMTMPLHPGALRYYEEAGLIEKHAPDEGAGSQEVMPIGEDARQQDQAPPHQDRGREPGPIEESYPDADVAAELPDTGKGGPLVTTVPAPGPSPAADVDSPSLTIDGDQPADEPVPTEPSWRQRAIL